MSKILKFTMVVIVAVLLNSCAESSYNKRKNNLDIYVKGQEKAIIANSKNTNLSFKLVDVDIKDIKDIRDIFFIVEKVVKQKVIGQNELAESERIKPDLERQKDELEARPISAYFFRGSFIQNSKVRAILETAGGDIFYVKVGDRIGVRYGIITSITEDKLTVEEKYQNNDDLWKKEEKEISE